MKLRLRLTARIVLIFGIFAAVLLAAVAVSSYYGGSESLKAAAISGMLAVAIEKEAALDNWMNERVADLTEITSSPAILENTTALLAAPVGSLGAERARQRMREELRANVTGPLAGYLELSVIEPEGGKVLLSTTLAEEEKCKIGRRYFENGKSDLYIQPPYYSPDTHEPAITASMPVRSAGGRVVAVIAARLNYGAMDAIIQRRTGLHQSDDSFLVNADRFVVTQPRFITEPVTLRRKLDTEEVRRCAARSSGVILATDYRDVPVIAVYRWNAKRQLGFIVKMDQAEALAPVRAFGQSVFLISSLALLIATALSIRLARTITRPVRALHESVRHFGEGKLHAPVPESTDDELGLLASEFNKMARKISTEEEQLRASAEELTRANEALQVKMVEHMKAEARATAASHEAKKANRAKSEFLSRMSHELRTPLNAILGFGQLLERQKPTETQRERIGYILNAGRHLLDLINEVLDISRIEAGRVQLSLDPVCVADALEEALDLMRPLAIERSIQLSASVDMDASVHVLADRQRLKQVLLNLLNNAVKYTPAAGAVTVSYSANGSENVRISVTDTGPGIPEEKLSRLFVPFERLGAEQSNIEGTGLGLALSQRLIQAMGGSIGVDTAVGKGSRFWIELARAKSPLEQVSAGREHRAPRRMRSDSTGQKILYIEDNLSNLTLVEQMVEERPDIQLITAMQGLVGLDLARQHSPDLILLDLHLPDVPGWDVLSQLKAGKTTRDIPVIVISADATQSQIDRLIGAGANNYLTKPLDITQFFQVLEETTTPTNGTKLAVTDSVSTPGPTEGAHTT